MKQTKNESRQSVSNYFLTVIVSVTMGAAVTWLIMSQRSTSNVRAVASAPPSVPLNPSAPDISGMSAGEAAVARGNVAYDHQQWSEAIRRYQEAIASGIDNSDVHTDLGNAYRFSGQPQQALTQYETAQRLNPQHENSLFNQISLFAEVMGDSQRAIPICEEFMRRFPNSEKLPAVREQLERAKTGRH
jgi:tetratricopeptide (TPR) repeat protein